MGLKEKILLEGSESITTRVLKDEPDKDMITINLHINKKKVGYIIIEEDVIDPYATIMYAAIISSYRGKGYYKYLLKAALAESKKLNLKGLRVRNADQTEDAKKAWTNIKHKVIDGTKYLEKL